MNNETRKKAKEKACQQFLDEATSSHLTSQFQPVHNLTPFALYNIDHANKQKLLDAIGKIPKENLLLIMLGEDQDLIKKLLTKHHAVFEQAFVKEFQGPISILAIDPGIKIPEGKNSIQFDVDPLKDHGVVSFTGVKAKFPLTPLFGPHKAVNQNHVIKYLNQKYSDRVKKPNNYLYAELNEGIKGLIKSAQTQKFEKTDKGYKKLEPVLALRRLIHPNALTVLNTLVEHPGPLFISSRITSLCYRSFKYLIDVRAEFGRKTLVRFGYTEPGRGPVEECVSAEDFPLFPNPFTKCMSDMTDTMMNKYYANKQINNSDDKRKKLLEKIKEVNTWADQELQKRTPAPEPKAKGGNRRNKTRKQKY